MQEVHRKREEQLKETKDSLVELHESTIDSRIRNLVIYSCLIKLRTRLLLPRCR